MHSSRYSLNAPVLEGYAAKPGTVRAFAQSFASKQAARVALDGPLRTAASRFFRDAAKNSQGFRISEIIDGGRRFEFFSPARNPGYGKLYVQEVNTGGAILREFKHTLGPSGFI